MAKHDTTLSQVDIWSCLWVSFTLGQIYPGQRYLVAKCDTTSCQVDIWAYVPPGTHLVAKCDTTLGQDDIWSCIWVRLTLV